MGKTVQRISGIVYRRNWIFSSNGCQEKDRRKTAPLLQLGTKIATGVAPSGFVEKDISGKEGWDQALGIFKVIAKSPLPFATRKLFERGKEFHVTDIMFPSSKGMTRYRTMELFKHAIEKQDEKLFREIYQDALDNNLPAYTLFDAAIRSMKAMATSDLNKDRKTLEDLEKAIEAATEKGDRKDIERIGRRYQRL